MKVKKDADGKLYMTEQGTAEELNLCDYVILHGQRFTKEDEISSSNRKNYEPGGKYFHLRNETDH